MNRQAIEYWLDGNNIPYETMDWGYVLSDQKVLKPDFIKEIGACKAGLRISTTGEFLIIDMENAE